MTAAVLLAGLLTLAQSADDAANGDYGGFWTWPEILQKVSELEKSKPDIVHRTSLGKTWEGRDIVLLKISDHAAQDEDEPEVLLMAGIHPREQQPQVCLMRLLEELVSGYGQDDRLTRLVNEREIWIIPVFNVDGKVYDMKHGNGKDKGAGWRKNRRKNPNETFGVDLNRNFPVRWGGSDDEEKSIVYEGPEPLSEPEARALARFVGERPLRAFVDFHSSMKAIFHAPYLLGSEQERFARMTGEMRRLQSSPYRATEVVPDEDPPARRSGNTGLTSAWGYYTQGVYSFIFEIAGKGFYPSPDEIQEEYKDNVREPILWLLEEAGRLPLRKAGAAAFKEGKPDRSIEPGATVSWTPAVEGPCDYAALVSESPAIQVTSEFRLVPAKHGFVFTVSRDAAPGAKVPMALYLWTRDHALSVARFTLDIR